MHVNWHGTSLRAVGNADKYRTPLILSWQQSGGQQNSSKMWSRQPIVPFNLCLTSGCAAAALSGSDLPSYP